MNTDTAAQKQLRDQLVLVVRFWSAPFFDTRLFEIIVCEIVVRIHRCTP
jgi:hypothetical protein